MNERKSLEQVLQELKEAEKEYNEKCLKYGFIEKQAKKKKEESNDLELDNNKPIEETKEETSSQN